MPFKLNIEFSNLNKFFILLLCGNNKYKGKTYLNKYFDRI